MKTFHEILIQQRGMPGIMSKDMVNGCIEWAKTKVFDYAPFPGIFRRAAAILYAYIVFHPFVDGNKRTALMTSSFFFFMNGLTLKIPDDSPEFTVSVAERAPDPGLSPQEEIERIANWFKPNVVQPRLLTFLYRRIRNQLSPIATAESLLGHPLWNYYYRAWRIETTGRFKKLLAKWPGHTEH